MLSPAVAVTLTVPETVALAAAAVGAVIAPVGAVVPGAVWVTVRVAVAVLFAASRAGTVTMLEPGCGVIPPVTDHVEVPAAVPLPPRSLAHVTWVMLML